MSRSPDPGGADRPDRVEDLLAPLDGRPGPARRLTSAASSDMVRAVLDAALQAPREPPGEVETELEPPVALVPVTAPAWPPWRRRLALAAAVLGAVSLGSGASALALRLFDIGLGGAELTPEPQPPPAPVPRRPSPPPAPRPPQEIELPSAMVEPQPEEPALPSPPRKLHRVVAAPPPAPVAAPAPVVVVPENLPPADLLAFANERRVRREWREADLFYRATVSRFPGTDAAGVAGVASATLHLQHLGDAAGALAAYRRTLGARPSGPVAEEARWGIVEAHRALGDGDAEGLALREFLDHHPDSALAPAARRRLARLSP
jgi:hypothetical protein